MAARQVAEGEVTIWSMGHLPEAVVGGVVPLDKTDYCAGVELIMPWQPYRRLRLVRLPIRQHTLPIEQPPRSRDGPGPRLK